MPDDTIDKLLRVKGETACIRIDEEVMRAAMVAGDASSHLHWRAGMHRAAAIIREVLGVSGGAVLALVAVLTVLTLACGPTPAPKAEQVFIARPARCVIEIRPAEAAVVTLDLREGESRMLDIGDTVIEVAVVAPYRGGPVVTQ